MSAYSDLVRNHFENPRSAGEIANVDAVGYQTNPVRGDTMRLTLRIDGGQPAPGPAGVASRSRKPLSAMARTL